MIIPRFQQLQALFNRVPPFRTVNLCIVTFSGIFMKVMEPSQIIHTRRTPTSFFLGCSTSSLSTFFHSSIAASLNQLIVDGHTNTSLFIRALLQFPRDLHRPYHFISLYYILHFQPAYPCLVLISGRYHKNVQCYLILAIKYIFLTRNSAGYEL